MKVKELIHILKDFHPDRDVVFFVKKGEVGSIGKDTWPNGDYYPVRYVEEGGIVKNAFSAWAETIEQVRLSNVKLKELK